MLLAERPTWTVKRFDPATGSGVAQGVGEVSFTVPDATDLEVGEAIFVSLSDLSAASAVWPAVAHWPISAPEAARLKPDQRRPGWADGVAAGLAALPYPLPAAYVPGAVPSFIAYDAAPNTYSPSGADLSLVGELQLVGLERVEGKLFSGLIAGRVASALERAWLSERAPLPGDALVVTFAQAGRLNARSKFPVLCVLRELRWLPHAWQETEALDAALDEQWEANGSGPESLRSDEAGNVTARFGAREVMLGRAEPAAARRWSLAWTEFLR